MSWRGATELLIWCFVADSDRRPKGNTSLDIKHDEQIPRLLSHFAALEKPLREAFGSTQKQGCFITQTGLWQETLSFNTGPWHCL